MKKYLYAILLLSIMGALVSGILLHHHFNPDSPMGVLLCGEGLENSCTSLSLSNYSTIFGMPIAAFGLFFYLLFIFVVLIADYANEIYYKISFAVLLPLSIMSLIIDIILIAILIMINKFCSLCFITYIVNILLFLVLFIWYKKFKTAENTSILAIYKDIITSKEDTAHKRASFSTFILFVIFLLFSTLSVTYVLKIRPDNTRLTYSNIINFIKDFYASKPEKIDLPKSDLIIGDPNSKVTITIFSDFLCSACYQLYRAEEFLHSKYKGKVKFIYYNYPLDKNCNDLINHSLYPNSCTASKAMIAAAKLGIQDNYIIKHFENYKKYKSGYNADTVLETLKKLKNVDIVKFIEIMNSKETSDTLKNHIAIGGKLKIDGTPTIFIADRRLGGSPPKEILEAIIINELKK